MLRKIHYSKIYCTLLGFYSTFDLKVGLEQSFPLPRYRPPSLPLLRTSSSPLPLYMYQQYWRECNKTKTEQAETQATAVAQLLMILQG